MPFSSCLVLPALQGNWLSSVARLAGHPRLLSPWVLLLLPERDRPGLWLPGLVWAPALGPMRSYDSSFLVVELSKVWGRPLTREGPFSMGPSPTAVAGAPTRPYRRGPVESSSRGDEVSMAHRADFAREPEFRVLTLLLLAGLGERSTSVLRARPLTSA